MPRVASTTTIPRDADRVVILRNPKAGPRAAQPWADHLIKELQREGIQAELFTDLDEAAALANRWHGEGRLRALVGAGGDGTAAELVNRTALGVPLALFPTGNENLLARYFHIERDPDFLCRTLLDGVAARIDAGQANGRIFLLMAGAGFDAEVVRRVHERRTGHINATNYLKAIAGGLWRYPFPEIHVDWQSEAGQTDRMSARWVFAFNLPCYGGGLRIAPHADGADGQLDLCTFQRGRFSGTMKYVVAIRLGRHQRLADWATRRVSKIRLTSAQNVPYQLDGDLGGWLPLEIISLPGRLTLIVSKELLESRETWE